MGSGGKPQLVVHARIPNFTDRNHKGNWTIVRSISFLYIISIEEVLSQKVSESVLGYWGNFGPKLLLTSSIFNITLFFFFFPLSFLILDIPGKDSDSHSWNMGKDFSIAFLFLILGFFPFPSRKQTQKSHSWSPLHISQRGVARERPNKSDQCDHAGTIVVDLKKRVRTDENQNKWNQCNYTCTDESTLK